MNEKGKYKLNLPKNKTLNEMNNEELGELLEQLKLSKMKIQGNKVKGMMIGGAMREIRKTIARILTIKQHRS